jgi:hypothetical protein
MQSFWLLLEVTPLARKTPPLNRHPKGILLLVALALPLLALHLLQIWVAKVSLNPFARRRLVSLLVVKVIPMMSKCVAVHSTSADFQIFCCRF